MRPSRPLVQGLLAVCLTCSTATGAPNAVCRVKAGESLWLIAKRNGVSVDALKAENSLTSEQVRAGQVLKLPSSARANPPPRTPSSAGPETPRALDAAAKLYARSGAPPASSLEEVAPPWVLNAPGDETQGERSTMTRLDVFPCVARDPGFGSYRKWVQVAPMAHVLSPTQPQLDADGAFDVLLHFHGREPLRKEWVKVMDNAVLVAVDIGIDSGAYAEAFRDPRTLGQVLKAVEAELSAVTRRTARVRHLALSAWSAGYGAVEQILQQPLGRERVDAVVLLDGLHAGFSGRSLSADRLNPFVDFAKRAEQGERLFFVSHSSIRTPGYASTTQTANYLVWKLGAKPRPSAPLAADPMGLTRLSSFSSGNFHVRGFAGSGAGDHCAHLALMRDVLRVHLAPRWQRATVNEPAELASRDALESGSRQ